MPPGTYRVRFDDWDTVNYFNRQPKVVCRFTVCTEGEGRRKAGRGTTKALTGTSQPSLGPDLREYCRWFRGRRAGGIALASSSRVLDAEIETSLTAGNDDPVALQRIRSIRPPI